MSTAVFVCGSIITYIVLICAVLLLFSMMMQEVMVMANLQLTNPSLMFPRYRTVDETAMMWECKNQATVMSLIPHSDIAEVGGMRAAGCTLQHQNTHWRTSIPFNILQGQQRKTAMTVDSMD